MSIFAVGPLIVSLLALYFGVFVYSIKKRARLNLLFSLLCISVFIWAFGYSQMYNTKNNYILALFWARIGYLGVVFIPVFTYHYIITFLELKRNAFIIKLVYLLGIFFLVISRTKLFLHSGFTYFWGYYPKAGPLYIFFVVFFALIFLRVVGLLYGALKQAKLKSLPVEMNRIKYVLFGFAFATTSLVDYVPNYGLEIYPWAYLSSLAWLICMGWASFKHRLMDINIALTRAGIFAFVYAFVLGIPFYIGYQTKAWFPSTLFAVLLATAGPFIYNYLRRRAEEVLLKEQKRYQRALLKLSQDMHSVKRLDSLLKLILAQVVRQLKLKEAGIYLLQGKAFNLKSSYPKDKKIFKESVPADSGFITHLHKKDEPMLSDEFSRGEIESFTKDRFELGMIVPCVSRDCVSGFMALGRKSQNLIYNELDISIFRILSLQAGLAIENCLFWEGEKERLAKEEQIRRQKSIDHFSASLVHEIGNPVFAAQAGIRRLKMGVLEDLKDMIPKDKTDYIEERLEKTDKVLDRVNRIFRAVKEFSSQTKGEQEIVEMDKVLETCLIILESYLKYEDIRLEKDIEQGLKVLGNKIHLEEVLMNLGMNAVHAVKRNEGKEKLITIRIRRNSRGTFLVEVRDNGYGIEPHKLEDIFLDFVTTKASSEGTGMGLARVRKIVNMHKGKVWAESKGKGKGAVFFVELPLAG